MGDPQGFQSENEDFVQGRIESMAPAIAKAFRGLASSNTRETTDWWTTTQRW